MKLYQSVGPNPRVTTMFIAEKQISLQRQFIDIVAGDNRQSAFLEKNAAGGVPLLELDDGTCIADSVAICVYLEDIHPSPTLIGSTPTERAAAWSALRSVDQNVIVPMTNAFRSAEGLKMFESRMLCVPEAAAGNKSYARDGLKNVNIALTDKQYLCGHRFTLADILLFCFVEFGAQVGQPLDPALTNLAAWQSRIAARPSATTSANPQNGV